MNPRGISTRCGLAAVLAVLLLLPIQSHGDSRSSAAVRDGDVRFEFSPPRLRYCGTPVERTRITVSWDVSGLGLDRAQVFINGTDGTLFASGRAVGQSRTGEWVTNGLTFVLYSPELEEVLATKAFRLLPCDTKKYPDEPLQLQR